MSELISGKTPRAGWESVLFLVTAPTEEMTMKAVVAPPGIYAALSTHGSIFIPVLKDSKRITSASFEEHMQGIRLHVCPDPSQ